MIKKRVWGLVIGVMVVAVGTFSCDSDGNEPVVGPDTTLVLKASKNSVLNDSVDFTKFTVIHADKDVTSECSLYLGDKKFSGDVFSGNVVGKYDFKAEYNGISSNIVTIRVEPPYVSFVRNLAVFDVTSTFCVYCPIGGGVIQSARKSYYPKVVPMYFHVLQSSPKDPFEMAQSKDMLRWLQGYGYPTIRFNNQVSITGATMQLEDFAPYISGDRAVAKAGLAIDTKYDESTNELTIDFKVRVVDARYTDQQLRLVGWFTEDSLRADQNSPNGVMANYVHNDVVREVLVGDSVTGEAIAAECIINAEEFVYRKVMKMNQGWKHKNSYINAYIYHRKGRATQFDTVLNVQRVAFGESIDYQIAK